MVVFDLPTLTKSQRKVASEFRKDLISDGFTMFQYSIYMRHCSSKERADVFVKRVKMRLPDYGHVGIMFITDRQWSMTQIFYKAKMLPPKEGPRQLEFF